MANRLTTTRNKQEFPMAENEKQYELETTSEIKQGHADIGKFNIAVGIVLTVVCIVYLILNFKP
jgi:hypothetical protein